MSFQPKDISASAALKTRAFISGVRFAALRKAVLGEAVQYGFDVLENTTTRIEVRTSFGRFEFCAQTGGAVVGASANSAENLFTIKEGLIARIAHYLPQAAEKLRWSDSEAIGRPPPNFHFTTILKIEPAGTCFTRVTVKADNLSSFTDASIHFRLVLPPQGLHPVEWPVIAQNGSIAWPKGDRALHRPVYTARSVDHKNATLMFDIFHHEGGRAWAWIKSAKQGDQLAIIGPGGGGIARAQHIHLYGDETAFPAIARIVEALPRDTIGRVVLQSQTGGDCGYAFDVPEGMGVTFIKAGEGADLAQTACADITASSDCFVWFAAEKAQAKTVRAHLKAHGAAGIQSYIVAFWSADGA